MQVYKGMYRCVYMLLGHVSVKMHGGGHVTLEICPKTDRCNDIIVQNILHSDN